MTSMTPLTTTASATTGATRLYEFGDLSTVWGSGDAPPIHPASRTHVGDDARRAFLHHLTASLAPGTGEGAGRPVPGSAGSLLASFTSHGARSFPWHLPVACAGSRFVFYTIHGLPLKGSASEGRDQVQSAPAGAAEPQAESVRWLREASGLSWERVGRLVGVSRVTLNNWLRGGEIADDNRRRLLAVRQIVELAARRHQGPSRLAAWLDTPRGAAGRTPFDLLAAGELDRARYLAVSEPSPGLRQAPAWAYRPLRPDEEARGERVGEALPPAAEPGPSEAGDDHGEAEWETVPDR